MLYLLRGCEKANEHQAALELLKYGLKREYGINKLPAIAKDSMGKPFFSEIPQICFNYSHSQEGILCGLHTSPIGVDIQGRIAFKESLVRRLCHPMEKKKLEEARDKEEILTRIWTAKESCLKYMGIGLRKDLRELDCSSCLAGEMEWQGAVLKTFFQGTFGMAVCCKGNAGEILEVGWEKIKSSFSPCNPEGLPL